MGYQQSFIQFNSKKDLVEQLQKYTERNNKDDVVSVYNVVKCEKGIGEHDIRKGTYLVVVGGERYAQRNIHDLKEEIGFDNVKEIHFIDDLVWEIPNSEAYLDEHFRTLEQEEIAELGINISE